MYGTSKLLPHTGAVGFTVAGLQFGVLQVLIVALSIIAAGLLLYRFGTRGRRYQVSGG